MEDDDDRGPFAPRPDSLLPYDLWIEAALRQVAVRALSHVAQDAMPGDHHFYITFRTDHPGVAIPQRLLERYPSEMTIVLQHQYWELRVDEEAELFSVGLSFGGIPSTLVVPFGAMVAFSDPYVQFLLRFRVEDEGAANDAKEEAPPEPPAPPPEPSETPQVVSLDAFRKKKD